MGMTTKQDDCNKMNLINNDIQDSKNDLQNLKDFIRRWELKIAEIKNQSLDNKQCYLFFDMFLDEFHYKFFYQNSLKNKVGLLEQLANDIQIALLNANNNYKQRNRNFWNILLKDKLKLPDFHWH